MANPNLSAEEIARSLTKPARGSYRLEREKQRAEEDAAELLAKRDAKARDGHKCRWPVKHKCRGIIEAAHLVDKSRGGADHTSNLFTVCSWIHKAGPESIHSKDLVVQPVTKAGADGICAFYRRVWSEAKRGEFSLRFLKQEVSIGIMERVT